LTAFWFVGFYLILLSRTRVNPHIREYVSIATAQTVISKDRCDVSATLLFKASVYFHDSTNRYSFGSIIVII